MVLVEYLDNIKYGKIAHFIDENSLDVFSRIIETEDEVIYVEFDDEIQCELRKWRLENAD